MGDQTEGDLLRGAKEFDQQVLTVIYDRYSERLYRYAVRLLGDVDLAEECVADTFARFLQALRAGRGPRDHLQAYLYRIAHNWITDQYRRQPPPVFSLNEDLQASETSQPPRAVEKRHRQDRMRAALRLLTPDQRQVVVLRFLQGMENEEVALVLQKPVGAVKALQHRALLALRRLLVQGEEGIYE